MMPIRKNKTDGGCTKAERRLRFSIIMSNKLIKTSEVGNRNSLNFNEVFYLVPNYAT